MTTTFKNILVPIDNDEESIKALEFAAFFASGTDAKITALHLMDASDYKSRSEFQRELASLVDDQLRPRLRLIHKSYSDIRKIELQTRALDKSVPEDILSYISENHIDFVIIKNQQVSGKVDWEDRFKKTVAYRLVRESPCPVFTYNRFPDVIHLKNILIPIDLSEGSLFKLPLGAALANQFNAAIHILSASEHQDDNEGLNQQKKAVHEELKQQKVKVINSEIHKSELPEAIKSYNQNNKMDLIIIMSRPGFKWSDLWISPKAKRIISHSTVPVISIRSEKPIEVDL